MTDIAKQFIAQSRGFLSDDYLPKIERCVEVLLERRQARSGEVTVLWAVYHAVEHFAMHTGQIIMLAKMRSGDLR